MQQSHLLTHTRDGITTLSLNRPAKRNAMNESLIRELLQALHDHASDATTRVLIINGSGEHFCAGADIGWMQAMAHALEDKNFHDAYLIAELMLRLYQFPKPTIVLAHGATYGGGLGLVAAADIAVASTDVQFSFAEVKLGLVPSTISPYIIAAMGARAANYYFLTGERFDATEAQRLGLVQRVTENHNLLNEGMRIAQTLLVNGPAALTAAKHLVQQVKQREINEVLAQQTAEHLANLRQTAEAREGLQAFLEKRQPQWR